MSKKIALISPYSVPENRGNAVTVRRVEKNLRTMGADVELFGLDTLTADEIVSRIASGKFDICHAFHAYHGGAVAQRAAIKAGIPYITTLTGSDLHEALLDDRRGKSIASLLDAAAIVAFHDSIKERLLSQVPELAKKTAIVPQGVEIPPDSAPKPVGKEFVFLLPAGLRPVKDVLFPLEPLAQLWGKGASIRFIVTGPVLDEDYASLVMRRLTDYPFASYEGAVDHQTMNSMYQGGDAVINCSLSEGGMANSLLEAMASNRPVLVSNIEGNRSLVTDGVNGLVYDDAEDFVKKAGLLMSKSALRLKLVENAFQKIVAEHDPRQEALRYLEIYRQITSSQKMKA